MPMPPIQASAAGHAPQNEERGEDREMHRRADEERLQPAGSLLLRLAGAAGEDAQGVNAGHHLDEKARRQPPCVADLGVSGSAQMAVMLGMGAAIGGDRGADLPADQPVGEARRW